MNTNSSGSPAAANTPPKSRRLFSVSFLVVALALAVGAYYSGPTLMSYYFLFEGQGQLPWSPARANQLPANTSPSADGNEGGARGGEEQNSDPVDRASRRPPAEFDDDSKPSNEEATPPEPKT